MKSEIDYVIVYGTNGTGYSDTTVLRKRRFVNVAEYLADVFHFTEPAITGQEGMITFFKTDDEQTTERVSIFPVGTKDIIVVSVEALCTEYSIQTFKNRAEARKELNKLKNKIVVLDEDSTKDKASGDGGDAYYHFEIV